MLLSIFLIKTKHSQLIMPRRCTKTTAAAVTWYDFKNRGRSLNAIQLLNIFILTFGNSALEDLCVENALAEILFLIFVIICEYSAD